MAKQKRNWKGRQGEEAQAEQLGDQNEASAQENSAAVEPPPGAPGEQEAASQDGEQEPAEKAATTTPPGDDRAATVEELESLLIDAPAEFVLEQLRAHASMATAQAAWETRQQVLRERLAGSIDTGLFVHLQAPLAQTNLYSQGGYRNKLRTHVDFQLRANEARTMMWLKNGLENNHCRLNNGRIVSTHNDAVRWLIEQISARYGEAERAARAAQEKAAVTQPEAVA